MISVFTGIKVGCEYFPEAFASLVSQKFVDWELLIAVNGLPLECQEYDRVLGWTKSHTAHRIVVLNLPECRNKPEAMHALLQHATGSHVAMLDVDDVWDPWKLAKQVGYLDEWDVVGTQAKYFGTTDIRIPIPEGEVTFDSLLRVNGIVNSASIVRRELALWPITDYLDDYPLWLELAYQGRKLYNVPGRPLTFIRHHNNQWFPSRDNSNVIREEYRKRARR